MIRRPFQLCMLVAWTALGGAFAQEAAPPTAGASPTPAPAVASNAAPADGKATTGPVAVSTNASTNVSAATAAPPAAPPPAPGSYDAFRLIADRNIFNPNRTSRSARAPAPTNEVRRTPRVEAFALVGTMSYGKGSYAFFDSPSSQYRKSLKAGEAIAGYTLKDIAPSHVKLARKRKAEDKVQTEEVELKVGHQMRREDEGEWQMIAQVERFSSAPATGGTDTSRTSSSGGSTGSSRTRSRSDASGAAPQPSAAGAAAAPASGGESSSASDLLKRLMEQRQKELNP